MQEKKSTSVKNMMLQLAALAEVKGLRGLAAHMGIAENNLYSWVARGKVGDLVPFVKAFPGINIEWLESGEGEPFPHDKPLKNGPAEECLEDEIVEFIAKVRSAPEFRLALNDILKMNRDEALEYVAGGRRALRGEKD